ncbi:hypothetical protein EFM54_08550 [Lentilactobacillus buchneri]|uniref:C39 family peptidase n=1 Tax=Lentilactobacillus buchneri TaxID=1581 RepID=UPI0021A4F0F8|nr:C39 family peptidase [Lentilactobacillus buchneri]MCT2899026.1 hypothetical protein [Lentilactobacillus buchneri]
MQTLINHRWLLLFGSFIIATVGGLTAYADTNSTYQPISHQPATNYYTKIRSSSHNYGIYRSGGYQTAADNRQPIAHTHQYLGKQIHIIQTESVQHQTWLKFSYHHLTGWLPQKATDQTYHRLTVPLIAQRPELPTGCEIVATTMLLNFAGDPVTKMQLAKQVPRSRNPNKGFVGSPYSPTGWYIYPKGLLKVVKHQLGTAKNMTGAKTATLKHQLANNHPVVVWVYNVDGFVNHALTLSGYSKTRFYYNDPWTNKKTSMAIKTMQWHRAHDGYRALSY